MLRARCGPPSERDVRCVGLEFSTPAIVADNAWRTPKGTLRGDDAIEYGWQQHQVHELGIELCASAVGDDVGGRPRASTASVPPIVRHRIEGVGKHNDARRERDSLSAELVWIALAIPALVMSKHSCGQIGIEWAERREHVAATRRMGDNGTPFRRCEVAMLVNDVEERFVNFPDVVKERDTLDDLALMLVQVGGVGDHEGIGGDASDVSARFGVIGVDGIQERLEPCRTESLGGFATTSFSNEKRAGHDAGSDG